MRHDQLPFLRQEIIEGVIVDSGPDLRVGQEITLRYSDATNEVLVGFQGGRFLQFLPKRSSVATFLQPDPPRIAWIADVRKSEDETTVVVMVSIYGHSKEWEGLSFLIGVDEKILQKVRSKTFLDDHGASSESVMRWLGDALLAADPSDSAMHRAVVTIGRPAQPGSASAHSFTIWGHRNVVADIGLQPDGRLTILNLVRGRQKDNRPLSLLTTKIAFQDASVAAEFRDDAVSKLREITAQADSYLGLWRKYNELEWDLIVARVREQGLFRYSSFRIAGRAIELSLELSSGDIPAFNRLDPDDGIEMDVSSGPPQLLVEGSSGSSRDEQLRTIERCYVGQMVAIERHNHRLTLEHEDPTRIAADIPLKGYVFASLGGDRRRLQRRSDAEVRIRTAVNHMPQLGLLLEGQPVPRSRYRTHKPLSTQARKLFASDPTENQQKALEVAINTADIALIQGPPGTGKTQVIAALLVRLAEIGESDVSLAGQILLTSYQHDAVQQAASRSEVFGLPAVNVSQRRGRSGGDGVESWKAETAQRVRARLYELDGGELRGLQALRKKVLAHAQALRTPTQSVDLLTEVLNSGSLSLSAPLQQKLIDRINELNRIPTEARDGDGTLDEAVRVVQGLHVTPEAFVDDGPVKAYKAYRRLEPLNVLSEAELQTLISASEWTEDEPPPFLPQLDDLKASLLQRLGSSRAATRIDFADHASLALLLDSVAELDAMLERSRNGAVSVLSEYLADLENDPDSVREALSSYTVVLAATCQQADSPILAKVKNDSPVFDTVVVDEAARANPLDLLIPLSMAKRRIVLVGDHRQLPQILEPEVERALNSNADETGLDPMKESLFERLFRDLKKRHVEHGEPQRTVTLDTQYRMHPLLGDFVSKSFYEAFGDPKVKSGRPATDFEHRLPGYEGKVAAWLSIPLRDGPEARGGGRSVFREIEARKIAEELTRLFASGCDMTFGVISFYRAQVNEIWKQLEKLGVALQDGDSYVLVPALRFISTEGGRQAERLQIGTVDSFQGKEFDVVMLSMTRANSVRVSPESPKTLIDKYGHLTLVNRLCVAMSRQRKLLIVAGDTEMVSAVPPEQVNLEPLRTFLDICRGEHGVVR